MTTPDDNTYNANQIHTQIQNDKTMIRERFEASDGTINAHNDMDSVDSGKHQASLVGLCKVHANYAALVAFTPKKKGTLHAVLSPKSFYTIDETGTPVKVYPADHSLLTGRDDDDHPQYQTNDLIRAFTGDLTLGNIEIATPGVLGTESLPESHASEDWESAHGAGSAGGRHVADDAVTADNDPVTTHSGTGHFTVLTNGRYGYPWMSSDTSASYRFWTLMLDEDNELGFISAIPGGSWMDAGIKYGDFS